MKIPQKCFNLTLQVAFVITFSVLAEFAASTACDKSRKVFEGVTSGVIRHGIDTNYTQVSFPQSMALKFDFIGKFSGLSLRMANQGIRKHQPLHHLKIPLAQNGVLV